MNTALEDKGGSSQLDATAAIQLALQPWMPANVLVIDPIRWSATALADNPLVINAPRPRPVY
jgi:hypothetical protein